MGIDKRGVSRGKCTECNECEEYETSGSSVLCEYCGHRPVQHEVISSSRARAGPELEPPNKWAKSAKEGEEVIIVDNVEVCENDKTHMEDDLVSKSVIKLGKVIIHPYILVFAIINKYRLTVFKGFTATNRT